MSLGAIEHRFTSGNELGEYGWLTTLDSQRMGFYSFRGFHHFEQIQFNAASRRGRGVVP